jgi:hypothetical protein
MNKKRPHHQNSALRDQTVYGVYLGRKLLKSIVAQYTLSVGSRQYSQRPIVCSAVIEMDTKCQHPA